MFTDRVGIQAETLTLFCDDWKSSLFTLFLPGTPALSAMFSYKSRNDQNQLYCWLAQLVIASDYMETLFSDRVIVSDRQRLYGNTFQRSGDRQRYNVSVIPAIRDRGATLRLRGGEGGGPLVTQYRGAQNTFSY